jgi:hypothetical protein
VLSNLTFGTRSTYILRSNCFVIPDKVDNENVDDRDLDVIAALALHVQSIVRARGGW